MRHVWKKNEKFIVQKVARCVNTTEEYKCLRCGLERQKTEGRIRKKKYLSYSYSRSNILFSQSDGIPECIDWEEEKSNHIDK